MGNGRLDPPRYIQQHWFVWYPRMVATPCPTSGVYIGFVRHFLSSEIPSFLDLSTTFLSPKWQLFSGNSMNFHPCPGVENGPRQPTLVPHQLKACSGEVDVIASSADQKPTTPPGIGTIYHLIFFGQMDMMSREIHRYCIILGTRCLK